VGDWLKEDMASGGKEGDGKLHTECRRSKHVSSGFCGIDAKTKKAPNHMCKHQAVATKVAAVAQSPK